MRFSRPNASPSPSSRWSERRYKWLHQDLLGLAILMIVILGGLQLLYGSVLSVHQDLAGGVLNGRLAASLGSTFNNYATYFPPAERAWFTSAAFISSYFDLRLDLTVVAMTSLAATFSILLGYEIRRRSAGSCILFLTLSAIALIILPILFKNLFGLREHIVSLGVWPYIVLRVYDPENRYVGNRIRIVVGTWLGLTLLMKYLYSVVVLIIELIDAALRQPKGLVRIENLISGAIVALYLTLWLGIDPSQREAIRTMVGAIDANLKSSLENLERGALHLSLAIPFFALSVLAKVPLRTTLLGFGLVLGAVSAAWAQSRWYSHHEFPIVLAYIAWLWIISKSINRLGSGFVAFILALSVYKEYNRIGTYQSMVASLDVAFAETDTSVRDKRVGLLAMHPSPFNQYLAMNGGVRWTAFPNTAYIATELEYFDKPKNALRPLPSVVLTKPGSLMLHSKMLKLWEDFPPDILIFDRRTSWPLRHISVNWKEAFSEDRKFQRILSNYVEVRTYSDEWNSFTYYVRSPSLDEGQSPNLDLIHSTN